MASIASLIVRIGAQDQEIQKALASVGEKARSVDADLRKLGNSPLAGQAQRSLETLNATMKTITDAQQRLADRAVDAARGLDAMGGASKLTDSQLKQVNKTLQDGLSAYRALGQEAPKELQKVADSVKGTLDQPLGFMQTKIVALGAAIGTFVGNAALDAVRQLGQAVKATFDYADALSNLSAATNVSVEGLQRLEAIGAPASVTMDTLARSVEQLQKHLDDPEAIKALDRMGVNYREIRDMAPEQQFLEIAKAVAAIKDPVEQANAGAALFGRTWASVAPAIKGNIDEILKSTSVVAREEIAALDAAGDAFDQFVLKTKRQLTSYVGELIIAAQHSSLAWRDIVNPVGITQKILAGRAASEADFESNLPNVTAPNLSRLLPQEGAVSDVGNAIKDLDASIAKARAEAERFRAVQDQLFGRATIDHVNDVVRALGGAENLTKLTATATKKLHDDVGQALDAYHALGRTVPALLEDIYVKTGKIGAIGQRGLFGPSLAGLAKTFVAFGEAAQDGTIYAQDFSQTLIGSQVKVDMLGNAVKVNLEPSVTRLAPVFEEAKAKAVGFGQALQSVFSGKGFGDIGKALKGSLDDIKTGIFEGFGNLISGGITNLIGKGLSLLGEGLKKVFKINTEESTKVSPLRDAFFKAAGGLDVLNPKVLQLTGNLKAVEDVFKAKTVDDYNAAIARLNTALGAQDEALQALDAAVQKYGFSIEELGPKFAQQRLNDQQGALLKDYKLLTAAQIDQNTLLTKTAQSFQDVVSAALKSGATVSDELQGPIQQLIDMGLLVDENGNKLTDLSRLKFGSLDSEFATLTKAINNLTRALGGAVDEADNLAQDRDFTIRGNIQLPDDIPNEFNYRVDGASTGAIVRPWGLQHLAAGGFARGSDTIPAMLTPGELVLNAGQQGHVAQALNSRSIVMNNEFHITGVFSEGDLVQTMQRRIVPVFTQIIEDNVRGSRTRLVDALGVSS